MTSAKRARLLAGLTVLAQVACTSGPKVQVATPAAQELVLWRIEQRGHGPLASFELCEASLCATPSKKSAAIRVRSKAWKPETRDVGASPHMPSFTPNAGSGREHDRASGLPP